MIRAAALVVAVATTAAMAGQTSHDFAAKFMEQCYEDTAVHCVTISPKMMEELTKQPDAEVEHHFAQAMQKLRSARIITASVRGGEYYDMAEELLRDNPQRFAHAQDFHRASAYGTFYTRRTSSGETVELIMLRTDTLKRNLVIVNLTGDLDEEFVNSLTKALGGPEARAERPCHTRPEAMPPSVAQARRADDNNDIFSMLSL